MNFVVVVNSGPYQHQAADSAYQFIRAALELGHQVSQVFFYHDGVYNASRLLVPPGDDRHLGRRWAELHDVHGVDLVLCAGAGLRRGIVDADGARYNGLDADNLAPAFRVAGLAQLVQAAAEADRLVTFGG